MPPTHDRMLKGDAADGPKTDSDQPPASALQAPEPSAPSTPASGEPQVPTPESAGIFSPISRGQKYITPAVFRQRLFDYFGYSPSRSTIHRWLQSGRLYAVRVGKLWFIPERGWDEFLKCCQLGEQF